MDINKFSTPKIVFTKAKKYLGPDVQIKLSTKKDKKYMVYDRINNVWVSFGQMGYEDNTKNNDDKKRRDYLKRSGAIKGNWKNNIYSPNNLARNILW